MDQNTVIICLDPFQHLDDPLRFRRLDENVADRRDDHRRPAGALRSLKQGGKLQAKLTAPEGK